MSVKPMVKDGSETRIFGFGDSGATQAVEMRILRPLAEWHN